VPQQGESLKCNSAVDLTVVLDGSSGVGETSFTDAKAFVSSLIGSLNMAASKSQAALVLAGGPKVWSSFEKCKLTSSSENALASCNVATSLPLSDSESSAKSVANGLTAPGGPAYIAGALSLAANQAEQSRPEAVPVVLVVGHGRPLSESRTSDEAAKLREKARLMWLVVGDKTPAPGSRILSTQLAASWASRPYSDNVFQVDSFQALLSLATVSEIISAVCPSVSA